MQFLIYNNNKSKYVKTVMQGRTYLGQVKLWLGILQESNQQISFYVFLITSYNYIVLESLIHHSLPILYSLVFSLSPQKTRGVTAITIRSMYIGKSRVYGWIKGAAVCCAHAVFERGSRQPLLYTHVDGNFQLASNWRRNHHRLT